MLPWQIVDRSASPDGTVLELARRGTEWEVRAGGHTLMSSRMHASEESLAAVALARVAEPRTVLVGGLGLGFTLRATLDALPDDARVVLAELSPAIVAWNREYLGDFAGRPLDDPRVDLRVGDVRERIAEAKGVYDAILLDVDNGPTAMVQEANDLLYGDEGVRRCLAALRNGGVLAVWSAAPDDRYLRRLALAGFVAEWKGVSAHRGRGVRHVIFLGEKMSRGGPDRARRPRYASRR
jgi:spermidine synthase